MDNLRRWIGYLLLFLGIAGLTGTYIVSYVGEQKNKELVQNFELDSLLEDINPDDKDVDFIEDKEEPLSKNAIAILSIPSVDIKYPVVKGTTASILKKSLGYFENTALPGEKGNFAVAGHRNSSYAKYFNRLDEVKIGDEIIVETREKTYTYIVDKSFKIHESETEVLEQTEDSRITLITCTNGYKPKYRIVVQGYLKN